MTTPPHPSWPPEQDRGAATPGVGPGAYGYPGYPVQRRTNGLAIASLVLGIIWIFWIGSILALILGYIARRQIRQRGESGAGLAVAGIVLGWVGVGFLALFLISVIFGDGYVYFRVGEAPAGGTLTTNSTSVW